MQPRDIILVPYPAKLDFNSGFFHLKRDLSISFPQEDQEELFPVSIKLKQSIREILGFDLTSAGVKKGITNSGFIFINMDQSDPESYILDITEDTISIKYSDAPGAFYAVSTLRQLIFQCRNHLPCIHIEDKPKFKTRGIMLDISRNKIPTMNTMYKFIDMLCDLKMNHLQLYIDGFSFAYPSYPEVWKYGTPMTGEEIMELDRYCRERYIELVPNQNSFGHMESWLEREEFVDLAEKPGGFYYDGYYYKARTLIPTDPRSLELVETLYDDLLPNFTSKLLNVGCDETLELGQGKCRELCEEKGVGRVYTDFLLKVFLEAKKRGKTPMFWGDMIVQYPELMKEIPKDAIALVWGYNYDQPNEEDCKKFASGKIPFYVCPGTSSWLSITGNVEQMIQNIRTAAINGSKYCAIGFLNTDWGDNGHWQYLPVSYPGIAYSAAMSWGPEQNLDMDIAKFLDVLVFKDKNMVMGNLVMDLGRYILKEKKRINNHTITTQVLYFEMENMCTVEGLKKEDIFDVVDYLNGLSPKLDLTDMQCDDAHLVYEEYRNAIRLLQHGAELGMLKLSDPNDPVANDIIKKMAEDLNYIMDKHRELWLARNRIGGLEQSLRPLVCLKFKYEEILKQ